MRASAFDPPSIPPAFWEHPEVCQALRKRDMAALFTLIHERTGLSQTRIGTAVGLGQGRISEVVNGIRGIRSRPSREVKGRAGLSRGCSLAAC